MFPPAGSERSHFSTPLITLAFSVFRQPSGDEVVPFFRFTSRSSRIQICNLPGSRAHALHSSFPGGTCLVFEEGVAEMKGSLQGHLGNSRAPRALTGCARRRLAGRRDRPKTKGGGRWWPVTPATHSP